MSKTVERITVVVALFVFGFACVVIGWNIKPVEVETQVVEVPIYIEDTMRIEELEAHSEWVASLLMECQDDREYWEKRAFEAERELEILRLEQATGWEWRRD